MSNLVLPNSSFKSEAEVSENLIESDYNRQRISPHPKDPLYPHLADIRLFLSEYSRNAFDQLLDYGCGGSPYRELMTAKRYIRADYVDCGDLDLKISPKGKIDLPDYSCDGVLSTQVLEHVFSPQTYLSEAFRILRPGGTLILTTHGIWEDHGCPYDFRRWTYDGLCREVEEAGFEVRRAARLTTGPRAIVLLFSQILDGVKDSRRHLSGWAFWLLRHSRFANPEMRHRWMDHVFDRHRVVYGNGSGHGIYLGLGIECIKPGS